jgi:hypothetical protein
LAEIRKTASWETPVHKDGRGRHGSRRKSENAALRERARTACA